MVYGYFIVKRLKRTLYSSFHIKKPLHFIGIGGAGMSAIAIVLSERGFIITGSDIVDKTMLQVLRRKGIRIFRHQSKSTIEAINSKIHDDATIVISTAVSGKNFELVGAQQARLEIIHRSDILAALVNSQKSVTIAGSHGKTTTSALITALLSSTNHAPTAIIGGVIPKIAVNGQSGIGNILVAEVDESDGSIVKFKSDLGIITNIELDHTNYYSNLQDLINTLQCFANRCERLLANRDCPILRDYFKAEAWWSNDRCEGVRFACLPVSLQGDHTLIDFYENGRLVCRFELPLPGLHNLSNMTAAIASCRMQGIHLANLTIHIKELKPPGRRFDYCGEWKGRIIVDDYAHHPREVKVTLEMARLMIKSNSSPLPHEPLRLIAIFQPHRYSRTAEFLQSFATALVKADQVLLTPIYSAGESPIPGISSAILCSIVERIQPKLIALAATDHEQMIQLIVNFTQPGDLILTMGAGDINRISSNLFKYDK